ncbi:alcohol oxidase-like protein [Obba rivulosa]|uniref:Alcohol oxidase-like protein n=1 Tax=Obba rivulosa TaxID=1052685 RepID=A0A8E2AR39_9APHY|nr:alcohol oxidase-like protein [Obba rivulosa]
MSARPPAPLPAENAEFDIVFAGGGAAAGVTAGRLAAADPSLRILILEGGPHTLEDLAHIQPARFLSHLAPGSKTVRVHMSKASDSVGGRELAFPIGNCLGGGSSVNWLMYTRPSASDYDDWEQKYGNKGWGAKDLLPLANKTETYQVDPNQPGHGHSGPLKVSNGGYFDDVAKDWIETAAHYNRATRLATDDANTIVDTKTDAFTRWRKWINEETGRRSDVPHHFLYNQSHNKNLHIQVGCHVKRVLFEGGRAVGVEYCENPDVREGCGSTVHTVRAKKLVVVAAGAFGSPAILERSGIGAKTVLEKVGVPQVVDLPGVGENFRDHLAAFFPYHIREDVQTLDGIVRGDEAEIKKWTDIWLKTGKGLMASNAVDAGSKLRPTTEERKKYRMGPEFEKEWNEVYANAPDKVVFFSGSMLTYMGDMTAPPAKAFSLGGYIAYPTSVGYTHISSAHDVMAPADFDARMLENPADVAVFRFAYKHCREIARRMPCYRGECASSHPAFGPVSNARAQQADGPVPLDAPDLEYSLEDEKALDDYIRNMGTCAMKPREKDGVVDSRLNVYGVEGLKVADMSICPANMCTNTYSTATTIGEKAAVIIAEELGIHGV